MRDAAGGIRTVRAPGGAAMADLPQLGDFFVTATRGPLLDRTAAKIIDWATATRDGEGNWLKAKVNHAGLYVGPTRQFPEGAILEALRRVRYSSILSYPGAIWYRQAPRRPDPDAASAPPDRRLCREPHRRQVQHPRPARRGPGAGAHGPSRRRR